MNSTRRRKSDTTRSQNSFVSVVLPAFNESAVLRELHDRIVEAFSNTKFRYEIIFVNDGSSDGSLELLDQLAEENSSVKALHFSRNFGHQAAVQAGVAYATGDAVIIMDSDLQDDPKAIVAFLDKWQLGYDVVFAVRHSRKENAVKRFLFYSFYRVLNAISSTPIPMDAGNFGLIDKAVAQNLTKLIERERFFPGLRSWVGYKQIGIPVERGRRHDDNPRVSMRGLFNLAKTAIFSFSTVPLSMFYVIAMLSLIMCISVTGFSLYYKLFTTQAIPGWASITIVSSFFGALNSLGIGILGEYAIRIYDQVRARPNYIVGRSVNFQEAEVTGPSQEEEMLEWLSENWMSTNGEGEKERKSDGAKALEV